MEHAFTDHWNDSSRCYYCGVKLVAAQNKPGVSNADNTRTRDHVHPKCSGGVLRVWSCQSCNWEKGALSLDEWRVIAAMRDSYLVVQTDFKFEGEKIEAVLNPGIEKWEEFAK